MVCRFAVISNVNFYSFRLYQRMDRLIMCYFVMSRKFIKYGITWIVDGILITVMCSAYTMSRKQFLKPSLQKINKWLIGIIRIMRVRGSNLWKNKVVLLVSRDASIWESFQVLNSVIISRLNELKSHKNIDRRNWVS